MRHIVREVVSVYGATPRLMTVPEYYRAADKGVFDSDEKLELIRGVVVQVSPQRSPHAWATGNLARVLQGVFPDACVRAQLPLHLDDYNEPEPDVLIVTGPEARYMRGHPRAEDVLLVVEISDTSLRKDRILKGRLYAEFRIPEYWILNLKSNRLEVYREPAVVDGKAGYRTVEVLEADATTAPLGPAGADLRIAALLPI